jgi:predicted patatin/cPLA2 family phospholipase
MMHASKEKVSGRNSAHPVIQLIKERHASNSKPGLRKDSFKLGLAIEGGGMRGVIATGMASALHFLGLVDVFDSVYGASAGAFSGCLFITHQSPLGLTIFYEDINNERFISFKRVFKKNRSIIDLDFLVHDVLLGLKPLNWKGVRDSKISLNIIVSSINRRRSVSFNQFESEDELCTLLKASSNLPMIAGPPISHKEDLLFDAFLYESIPYETAIRDGCTHILVLLTRPFKKMREAPSFLKKAIVTKKLRQLKPGLDEDYLKWPNYYNRAIEFLYKSNHECIEPPYIYSIYPGESEHEIGRLEKDRQKLVKGGTTGMEAVLRIFSPHQNINFHEVLYPVNELGVIPIMTGDK